MADNKKKRNEYISAQDKKAIILQYLCGKRIKEISQSLKISKPTVLYNINQFKNKDLDYNRDKLLNDVKLKLFKMFADYDIISDNLRLTIIDLQAQLDNNNDNKLSMKQIALIKADIIRLGVKLTDCNKEFTSMIVKMGLPRSEKETSKESYPKNLTRNNFPKKKALKKIEIEDAELIESEKRLEDYKNVSCETIKEEK